MMKTSFFNDATTNMPLDYSSVLQSISEFRRSGGHTSQIRFDGPQTYYFKIFFYFEDNVSPVAYNYGVPTSNLLGLTYDGTQFSGLPWEDGQVIETQTMSVEEGYVPVNTALNYLLLNYEWDRARKLTEFIYMLSEISYKYPWYFKTISGLDKAIERKEVTESEFKLDDQRKSFQIKCLHDSENNKIGTLLDLYRNVVYSQLMHKEILPANLRKFDMGIFIFSRPLKNMHRKVSKSDLIGTTNEINWDTPHQSSGKYASFDPYKISNNYLDQYKTSYKYLEFHNCEFDYNSSASAYSELDNSEGFKQEYTINIFYDNMVENRFDEWLMKDIGDISTWDLNLRENSYFGEEDFWNTYFMMEQFTENTQFNEREERAQLLTYKGSTNFNKKDITSEIGEKAKDSVQHGTTNVGNMAKNSVTSAVSNASSNATSSIKNKAKETISGFTNLKDSNLATTVNQAKDIASSVSNIGSSLNSQLGQSTLWKGKLAPQNKGIFSNAVNQATGYIKGKYINPKIKEIKNLALGNLYAVQIKKQIKDTKAIVKDVSKGNLFGVIDKAKKMKNGWQQKS